jgi:pimeloyl-ACP methyl ester carboxylesterase
VVLGHSWGTLVAIAMALKHPGKVKGLVLASGYYYPTARADVPVFSLPAVPVLGDVLSHTVAPIVSRLMWPRLLRKVFGPSPVPTKFQAFPKEMAIRPSQLRAGAAESALMIPSAHALQEDYRKLTMPVIIIAGADDQFIESEQSAKLHQDIPHSTLRAIPGTGHMLHQTATAELMAAIDIAAEAWSAGGASSRPTSRTRYYLVRTNRIGLLHSPYTNVSAATKSDFRPSTRAAGSNT